MLWPMLWLQVNMLCNASNLTGGCFEQFDELSPDQHIEHSLYGAAAPTWRPPGGLLEASWRPPGGPASSIWTPCPRPPLCASAMSLPPFNPDPTTPHHGSGSPPTARRRSPALPHHPAVLRCSRLHGISRLHDAHSWMCAIETSVMIAKTQKYRDNPSPLSHTLSI